MARGRAFQVFSPGLFIRQYMESLPDRTAYPEAVHYAYRYYYRWITHEQRAEMLLLNPGLENRFHEEAVIVTRRGAEVRQTVYRLMTKRKSGRPPHPYRLARYAAFMNLWHVLVRLGALRPVLTDPRDPTSIRTQPALGKVSPEDQPRIQTEALGGVGRWGRRAVETRPRRHYYQLTEFGIALGEAVWRNPRSFERTGVGATGPPGIRAGALRRIEPLPVAVPVVQIRLRPIVPMLPEAAPLPPAPPLVPALPEALPMTSAGLRELYEQLREQVEAFPGIAARLLDEGQPVDTVRLTLIGLLEGARGQRADLEDRGLEPARAAAEARDDTEESRELDMLLGEAVEDLGVIASMLAWLRGEIERHPPPVRRLFRTLYWREYLPVLARLGQIPPT